VKPGAGFSKQPHQQPIVPNVLGRNEVKRVFELEAIRSEGMLAAGKRLVEMTPNLFGVGKPDRWIFIKH
jgi:hypothetical protein